MTVACVLECCRKSCLPATHQYDSDQAVLTDRISADQEMKNGRTADTAPVRHPDVTEGNVFMNGTTGLDRTQYRQQISRLSSNESAECPGSIFDYRSTHPSVDIDDFCPDSIELEVMSPDDSAGVEVNKGSRSSFVASHDKSEQKSTQAVKSSQSTEVPSDAAVHVKSNRQSSLPAAAASKSQLPPSSLRPPSSRTLSRLPALRSHAAARVASGSHHAGDKAHPVTNGLILTNAVISSASSIAGSKAGPNRFH